MYKDIVKNLIAIKQEQNLEKAKKLLVEVILSLAIYLKKQITDPKKGDYFIDPYFANDPDYIFIINSQNIFHKNSADLVISSGGLFFEMIDRLIDYSEKDFFKKTILQIEEIIVELISKSRFNELKKEEVSSFLIVINAIVKTLEEMK